jgi:hypothetical protein
MTRVAVDRLAVRAPGLTPEQARRLQSVLGELLGDQRAQPASQAPAQPASQAPLDAVDELARRIVAEITSELQRRI